MNRVIKFRGKRVDNGEWVYGDLLTNNGDGIIVRQVERDYISRLHTPEGDHWAIQTPAFKVNPATVGQFTGLHDKDGKEIYEGDVLVATKHSDGSPFSVFYDACSAMFMALPFGTLDSAQNYSRIIGNLHDNPNLITR